MQSAGRHAARVHAIAEAKAAAEELVQVPGLILLVEQVVAEQRDRPAVARTVQRRARTEQRIAVDDRLRVGVVLKAPVLLRDERQVGRQIPAPAA